MARTSQYTPVELLPIYPAIATTIRDGRKYKCYYETDWHQVMTEDGISLCKLLKSLPSVDATNFFRFCAILRNSDKSAMEQLYEMTSQQLGDIYLVETTYITNGPKVYEVYMWLDESAGWVYCGTTNRKETARQDGPEVLRLFPEGLGKPDAFLIVSKDGREMVWGPTRDEMFDEHNSDEASHADIREALDLKADKMSIYNDVLVRQEWTYNGDYPSFEYVYTSENLPASAYFDICPIVQSKHDGDVISKAGMYGAFEIKTSKNDEHTCAIIRAKRVPDEDIKICVKVFGAHSLYNNKDKEET